MILRVELNEGFGGVAADEIHMILPDVNKPDTHSVIYTTIYPSGITVKGNSNDVCALWWAHIEGTIDEQGDEEEEDEGDRDHIRLDHGKCNACIASSGTQ